MITYSGRLITAHKTENNTRFSQEAIDEIMAQANHWVIPVTINFSGDPIGVVSEIEKEEDGSLVATVKVTKDKLEKLGLYLVPGGTCRLEDIEYDKDGTRVIKHFDLNCVSFTILPADAKLSPIKKTG